MDPRHAGSDPCALESERFLNPLPDVPISKPSFLDKYNNVWTKTLVVGLLVGLVFLGVMDAATTGSLTKGTAPDFELERPTGELVKLSELRGQTVVVAFWATWCAPCQQELPQLAKLVEGLKRPVQLVMINEDDRDTARTVVPNFIHDSLPMIRPYVVYGSGSVATAYQLRALPTLYVIDPKGEIVGSAQGLASPKRVRKWIEESQK